MFVKQVPSEIVISPTHSANIYYTLLILMLLFTVLFMVPSYISFVIVLSFISMFYISPPIVASFDSSWIGYTVIDPRLPPVIDISPTLPAVVLMFVILKRLSLCVLTVPIDAGLISYITTLLSLV